MFDATDRVCFSIGDVLESTFGAEFEVEVMIHTIVKQFYNKYEVFVHSAVVVLVFDRHQVLYMRASIEIIAAFDIESTASSNNCNNSTGAGPRLGRVPAWSHRQILDRTRGGTGQY